MRPPTSSRPTFALRVTMGQRLAAGDRNSQANDRSNSQGT